VRIRIRHYALEFVLFTGLQISKCSLGDFKGTVGAARAGSGGGRYGGRPSEPVSVGDDLWAGNPNDVGLVPPGEESLEADEDGGVPKGRGKDACHPGAQAGILSPDSFTGRIFVDQTVPPTYETIQE
jgi:hypothetical protein